MAGSGESSMTAGQQLSRIVEASFVTNYMEAGGCLREFWTALEECDRGGQCGPNGEEAFANKKLGEVIPVSVESCVKATAALGRCMRGNKDVFRGYIVAMDKGIEDDERRRQEPDVEVEDGQRWRWWTGMRKS